MRHFFQDLPGRRRRHGANARAGITLIELLVALGLVGIVLAAAGSLLLSSFSNDAAYRQQNNVQQQARYATDIVADDLKGAKRVATLVTEGTVQAMMPTATVQGLSASNIASHTAPLFFNIYGDDDNPMVEKRVRYWLNGSDLRREVVAYDPNTTTGAASSATGGIVVARNITTFTATRILFSGSVLDARNYHIIRLDVVATDPANAALAVDGTPVNKNAASQTRLTTNVTLRNNLL